MQTRSFGAPEEVQTRSFGASETALVFLWGREADSGFELPCVTTGEKGQAPELRETSCTPGSPYVFVITRMISSAMSDVPAVPPRS